MLRATANQVARRKGFGSEWVVPAGDNDGLAKIRPTNSSDIPVMHFFGMDYRR